MDDRNDEIDSQEPRLRIGKFPVCGDLNPCHGLKSLWPKKSPSRTPLFLGAANDCLVKNNAALATWLPQIETPSVSLMNFAAREPLGGRIGLTC